MKETGIILIALLFLTAIVLFGRSRFLHEGGRQQASSVAVKSEYIDYTGQILRSGELTKTPKALAEGKTPIAGITSHHLPTAENFINELYSQVYLARPQIDTFVIVGPDHFERCKTQISTTDKDFLTPFGILSNNYELAKILLQAGAGEDSSCFMDEHTVGVQASFIKKYFPQARLTPVLFSSAASMEMAEKLVRAVFEADKNVFVIGSTDFSHYEPLASANRVDKRTEEQIKDLDVNNAMLRQVDSPAALGFVIGFAEAQNATVEYFNHANSYDFTGSPDNTTSYFNVIFAK